MLRANKRYWVYGGLCAMMMINYIDRVNLSVAAEPISKTYGLSPIQLGYLLSAYLWTYLLLLVPLGIAVDRWGVRRVITGSMAVWSVGGMLTGLATGFGTLVASRMVLGAGEAAGFPAGGRTIREWAPRSERGLAASWLNGGSYLGPAMGAVAVGWIVTELGWRESFLVTGGIGLVGAAVWFAVYRRPEEAGWLSSAERDMILAERDAAPRTTDEPREPARTSLAVLLRSRTMLGLALAQGCAGYTLYLFLSWLPTYLVSERGMDVFGSGLFTAAPYAAAAVLGLLLGRTSDVFLRRRGVAGGGRRSFIAVCLLCASVILVVPFVSSTWLLLVVFSLSLTCVATAMAMNIALTNDLLSNSARSGVAVSLLIFGGNSFGLLAPIVTGYAISATGSFSTAFGIAGMLLLVGTTLILTSTRKAIDADTVSTTPPPLEAEATPSGR